MHLWQAARRFVGVINLLSICSVAACTSSTDAAAAVPSFEAQLWVRGAMVADFAKASSTTAFVFEDYIDIESSQNGYQINLRGGLVGSGVSWDWLEICQGASPMFLNYIGDSPSDGYSALAVGSLSKSTLSGSLTMSGTNPRRYSDKQVFPGKLEIRNGNFRLPTTKAQARHYWCGSNSR